MHTAADVQTDQGLIRNGGACGSSEQPSVAAPGFLQFPGGVDIPLSCVSAERTQLE